ncbi:MAG: hypothetical protein Q8P90_04160 [bacterium]|nr:hypothetical protein [bacterium]
MSNILESYSAEEIRKVTQSWNSDIWVEKGRERALKIFHEAAKRVPAYKDFLQRNDVKVGQIRTWEDFQTLPIMDKKTYLKQYPMEALGWDGKMDGVSVITSTSGSTGEPFYFKRTMQLDWQYSVMLREFIDNSSHGNSGPILVINGFSMGVWIGGLITYKAFEIAGFEGDYSMSIITPGINKQQILNTLTKLAPNYAQTILIGYPPFVKDIIDEAVSKGINLEILNLRLLFAAEGFNDQFRDYLSDTAHVKNKYLDTMNIYGSADLGAMGSETPFTIFLRSLALKNDELFSNLFSATHKTPTLAQYNPLFINFEAADGELLLTGDNAIPLIRYAIGDQGGIFSYDDATKALDEIGVDAEKKADELGISESIRKLPFVYLFERSDFVTTLYGLQIYPENIREVMMQNEFLDFVTGKFTLETKFDDNHDQYLEVNVELKQDVEKTVELEESLLKNIMTNLYERNAEYKELHTYLKDRAVPRLKFWRYEDPAYFKSGVKQKWVKKQENIK